MRWSREGVKNYVALKNICPDAWQTIVGTTKVVSVPNQETDAVPASGTTVPVFTENMLRSITSLTAEQQLHRPCCLPTERL